MDSATILVTVQRQLPRVSPIPGKADLIWTCDNPWKLSFLFILPFHNCFDYAGVIAPEIDEDMGNASLWPLSRAISTQRRNERTSQIASKKAKDAVYTLAAVNEPSYSILPYDTHIAKD
jgi:hypothetical protein